MYDCTHANTNNEQIFALKQIVRIQHHLNSIARLITISYILNNQRVNVVHYNSAVIQISLNQLVSSDYEYIANIDL